MNKLTTAELDKEMGALPGWELAAGKLHREFEFEDFSSAFAFMTRAALVSERLDHHPDWFNSYNRVSIDLSTHSAGGITALDVKWARAVSALRPS
jgi:4a-hydroxytetrahydrobiopterin dehydratase